MTININYQGLKFGVGDKIRVYEAVKEQGKKRKKYFEGLVISIKGNLSNKTFTLRSIGSQGLGIERIFPLNSPTISEIKIIKNLKRGIRHSKLFYLRKKTRKAFDRIYTRASRKIK